MYELYLFSKIISAHIYQIYLKIAGYCPVSCLDLSTGRCIGFPIAPDSVQLGPRNSLARG